MCLTLISNYIQTIINCLIIPSTHTYTLKPVANMLTIIMCIYNIKITIKTV